MPRYQIEAYELYSCTYDVDAEDAASALIAFRKGEGTVVENSMTYLEPADEYGSWSVESVTSDPVVRDELWQADVDVDAFDGICRIEREGTLC